MATNTPSINAASTSPIPVTGSSSPDQLNTDGDEQGISNDELPEDPKLQSIPPDAQIEFHPLSMLFPLMEGPDFDALVADIKANGQCEPITLHEEKILEGRNRYRACKQLGKDTRSEPYIGDDPLGYVISKNLRRRHLIPAERAVIAEKLATMPQGERTDLLSAKLRKVNQAEAAKIMNISVRYIQMVKAVGKKGVPELKGALNDGKVSLMQAAKIAKLPQEEQAEALTKPRPKRGGRSSGSTGGKAQALAALKAKLDKLNIEVRDKKLLSAVEKHPDDYYVIPKAKLR
jgi:ParB-like chromosome segregation protein Spo0J